MSAIDPPMATRETLARQLFDVGLAPDGVTPIMTNSQVFSRIVRNNRVPWFPGMDIADVWHLVVRYRISIVFPPWPGSLPITIHAPFYPRAGSECLQHEIDIPLAIGRIVLRMRTQELAAKQEKTP